MTGTPSMVSSEDGGGRFAKNDEREVRTARGK